MKKNIFIFLSIVSVNAAVSQSIQIIDNSTNAIIPSQSVINVITAAGDYIKTEFKVKNNSSTSNVIAIQRTAIVTNSGANFPFCFACQCLPPTTFSTSCTFAANETVPSGPINSSGLFAEINEGAVVGYSKVKYKLFVATNPADSAVIYLTYNGSVGLFDKTSNRINLSISPNPINDVFIVKHGPIENKNASIKIVNIVGSIIKEIVVEGNETHTKIDASQLVSGIYFISVYSNNVLMESKKIIISK